ITVPVANDENGLNISAQLVGAAWQEQVVLDAALSLENIIKGK
ncbi:hypothetical protein, partial [Campylobacter lanienae]